MKGRYVVKFSRINDIIQLVAVIGVMVGLVLVIYEIRENNRIAINQATIDMNSLYNEWSLFMSDPERAKLFIKSLEDPHSITRVEMLQLIEIYLTALVTFRTEHYLSTRGGIEMYPESTLYADASDVLSGPIARRYINIVFDGTETEDGKIILEAVNNSPPEKLLLFLDSLRIHVSEDSDSNAATE